MSRGELRPWPGNSSVFTVNQSSETLRRWVMRDRSDRGQGDPGGADQQRTRGAGPGVPSVADLEAEREILPRAAACLAKEIGR
jgi:hypothetical protein